MPPILLISYVKAIFIFPRAPHLKLIGTNFPESVYPHQATEPTSISAPASTADELIGLLSSSSSSPMELALAAILLEAKNKYGNSRSNESLSLLEELQYKLKAYICKKRWICTDPAFIAGLESYSKLVPEPETYLELLVALRHHSLVNNLDLFDKVVYSSLLYDLSETPKNLDTLNDIIDQASSRLSNLVNPGV